MGHEVVYCSLCGERILEADFAKRGAFRIESKAACGRCRDEVLATLTPAQRAALATEQRKAPAPPPPPEPAPRETKTRRIRIVSGPAKTNPMPLIVAGVVVAVVAVIAIVASSGRGPSPAPGPGPKPAKADTAEQVRESVQQCLDEAKALQTDWAARPRVLDAYARAAGVAKGRADLVAMVEEARRNYLTRFDKAALAAAAAGLAAESYSEAAGALASMPAAFAESEAGKRLKAKVEELRARFKVGEWRSLLDDGLKGWTRYVLGPAIKGDNWIVDRGVLVGTSSFPGAQPLGTADELVFDEPLTDYELEIEWIGEGEPADGKAAALIILPRTAFDGGKRLVSRAVGRATFGKKLSAMLIVTGAEAEWRVDGRNMKQPLDRTSGQLCLGLTPGLNVRIEKLRLKRLK